MATQPETSTNLQEALRIYKSWPQLSNGLVIGSVAAVIGAAFAQWTIAVLGLITLAISLSALRRRWRNPAMTPGLHNWVPSRWRSRTDSGVIRTLRQTEGRTETAIRVPSSGVIPEH